MTGRIGRLKVSERIRNGNFTNLGKILGLKSSVAAKVCSPVHAA
jgi:hypothetical protein